MTSKQHRYAYCPLPGGTRRSILHVLIAILGLVSGSGTTFAADVPVDMASLDKGLRDGLRYHPRSLRVKETEEYYVITGNSEKDLQQAMRENGVRLKDGNVYDSFTRWDLQWDYDYDRSFRNCSANAFAVTAQVTIRYPKWAKSDDAPPSLVAKWEAYLRNLILHESVHRDMVLKAAADLSPAVANLAPADTCDALDRNIQTLVRMRMQRLREDGAVYDRATGHGLTQGAVLR